MKKIILTVFSILSVLVIALLVGPSFIDWNKYKEQIITQVKTASGYNIDITGDLSLSLLPFPKLKIEGLVVEAPTKVKFENLLQMKSAEVSVQLAPLLQKNIAVDKVTLIEPVIHVEMFKDGNSSWMTQKMKAANSVVKMSGEKGARFAKTATSNALNSIALKRVEIENGRLTFVDHNKDATHKVQNINIGLNARTLNGPYNVQGDLTYNDMDVRTDMKVGAYDPNKDSLTISGMVGLPKEQAELVYNGVVATKAPFDAQGQIKVSLENGVPNVTSDNVSIEGLLTANDDKIEINDLIGFLGDARASGKFSVTNFKQKNPVNLFADLKFSQAIDLGSIQKTMNANKGSTASNTGAADNVVATRENGFVPASFTLPMAIDAQITLDAPAVKVDGKTFNGVFLSVTKKASKATVTAKVLEIPGQGKVEGRVDVSFGASSVAPKSGAVTYSDPSITFVTQGNVGQIEKALNAFAPQVDKKTASMFKTAQFDLKGTIAPNSVSLKDSVVNLDQTSIGVGGRYTPSKVGRANAVIDLSVGDINVDQLLGNEAYGSNTQQASASNVSSQGASSAALKMDLEEAVRPFKEFTLPVNLVFDVSVQKARFNGVDINGIRLTGESAGNKLTLKNASVNDYQGAAISARGLINDRSTLSGMDVNLGFKTSDVQGFAKAMKIDVSTLPATLKTVDADVALKGDISALGADAKIKAMSGQLDVAGTVKNALQEPEMVNMRVGLKHPNLSNAIKIVAPDFKGHAGLAQAVNLSTNVNTVGKDITLENLQATLGTTSVSGNVDIKQNGSKQAISGALKAGTIALDELLGARQATGSSSKASGSASAASSKERWSKAPINVDWMNMINVNLDLSANMITYGVWNFVQPSTTIKVQNGVLDVANMKAGIFGGQAILNANVKAPSQSGGALSLDVDSTMSDISLETLAYALSKSKKLQSAGTVSLDFDVSSNGASAFDLVNALNGNANLNGTNVALIGFDLAKLARGLATEEKLAVSALSVVEGALSGGQTKFDIIKGDYKITKGVVNVTSMIMDSDEAMIQSTGYADLPKWFINVDNKITLKTVPDLAPFEVKIKGPLDNPTDTFGKNILQDYIQDKVKRKLTKELPDVLGDDVTDKLQKFGILPQKQQAAPTEAPANDNGSPAPKQESAPKKIEKPEDALKELLNSDNPEDAVGNVLKGLF